MNKIDTSKILELYNKIYGGEYNHGNIGRQFNKATQHVIIKMHGYEHLLSTENRDYAICKYEYDYKNYERYASAEHIVYSTSLREPYSDEIVMACVNLLRIMYFRIYTHSRLYRGLDASNILHKVISGYFLIPYIRGMVRLGDEGSLWSNAFMLWTHHWKRRNGAYAVQRIDGDLYADCETVEFEVCSHMPEINWDIVDEKHALSYRVWASRIVFQYAMVNAFIDCLTFLIDNLVCLESERHKYMVQRDMPLILSTQHGNAPAELIIPRRKLRLQ